jgi:leucyl aminopeptidase
MQEAALPPAELDAMASLALQVNVIGVFSACENMPGGRAIQSGDILKSDAGQHVEALNTVAEVRLILGDVLAYASDEYGYERDGAVDPATLTGACIVALGRYASGAISNAPAFQEQVARAENRTGDPVWPLPNFLEFREALRGKTAGVQNTGSRDGGALKAGMFLKQFVGHALAASGHCGHRLMRQEHGPHSQRGRHGRRRGHAGGPGGTHMTAADFAARGQPDFPAQRVAVNGSGT